MKKFLCVLFVGLLMLFSVTGCGNQKQEIDEYSNASHVNKTSSDNNLETENSNQTISEVTNNEMTFPTIENYISELKSGLKDGAISEGKIIDGKYEFYLSEVVKVGLVLNNDNEVVNASFLSNGNINNFANDIIYTIGIGVVLMKPLYELYESEKFDSEKAIQEIYAEINKEIEENNYQPDFNMEYKYGDCNFTMSSIDSGGSIKFIVSTGYKSK